MYHFFVTTDQITDTHCRITGQDVNHIKNVLRMKPGERITVRDGVSRSYLCEIDTLSADAVEARILSVEEEHSELSAGLYLLQALPKADKMEFIIQKAVELGVREVIPVATRRCVVRLDDKKADAKVRRWNAIAEGAAKQSGRAYVPRVAPVVSFAGALERAEEFDLKLLPYELAEDIGRTRSVLAQAGPGMKIGIFIGPEGGFDTEEAKAAQAAGFFPITLGRRILRTETAGMTALSILMFLLEE